MIRYFELKHIHEDQIYESSRGRVSKSPEEIISIIAYNEEGLTKKIVNILERPDDSEWAHFPTLKIIKQENGSYVAKGEYLPGGISNHYEITREFSDENIEVMKRRNRKSVEIVKESLLDTIIFWEEQSNNHFGAKKPEKYYKELKEEYSKLPDEKIYFFFN